MYVMTPDKVINHTLDEKHVYVLVTYNVKYIH
jgi:hypothetical protein